MAEEGIKNILRGLLGGAGKAVGESFGEDALGYDNFGPGMREQEEIKVAEDEYDVPPRSAKNEFVFDAQQFMLDKYNKERIQPEIIGKGFDGQSFVIRTPNGGSMIISLEDFIANFGEPPIKFKGIERDADDSPYRYNQGGRVGYQSGNVVTQQYQTLPPDWVEALGRTYATDLTKQAGIPSITTAVAQQPGETAAQFAQRQAQAQQFGITKAGMAELAPQVAAQDPYQAAAYAQAVDPTTGLGAYQPFLTKAGTAADAATGLTGTGAGTGVGSIESYMSPYQQQVIDATMADYDAQAAKSRLGLGAQAVSGGAFGSGRHGIAEAEFDALSNRGRAAQLANLRSTGFQQAAQRRQQDLANQMGIANLQSGLGAAQQDFSRAQIAGLGTLGATQQAQNQAILDAQRQASQMAVQDPINRLNLLGSGVTGLMGGMGQTATTIGQQAPQSSPLATALGVGLTGADIYSRLFRPRYT